jgi:hypothetical protein
VEYSSDDDVDESVSVEDVSLVESEEELSSSLPSLSLLSLLLDDELSLTDSITGDFEAPPP